MRQVIDDLQRLRRRSRAMLVVQRLSLLLACTLGLAALIVMLDYALRLPSGVRVVLLAAGLGALGWGLAGYVAPAIAFSPSLTQLALRVERILPGVAGRLASSVEFVAAGVDQGNSLAARSVRDTEGRLAGESVTSVVRAGRTATDVGALAMVAAVVAIAVLANPGAASIGVSRLLLPYGSAQWPARTGVRSMMDQVVQSEGVYPRGKALPLRAAATKPPVDQRVEAHYRLKVNGQLEPWQHIVLTHQGNGIHERLVDTTAEAIELWFSTADAQTNPQTIALVPPPAVQRAMLDVAPPSYAKGRVPDFQAELGPGVDARAATEHPSLIGSSVTLRLELNKSIPVQTADNDAARTWLSRTLGWNDGQPLPTFSVDADDASRWTLRWTLAGTRSLSLNLVDEHGLANSEPITYRIDAVEDRLLTVTITQPQADETVLPTAQVSLAAEARDDVAVVSLALEASVQQSGASAEKAGDKDKAADAPAAKPVADAAPAWSVNKDVDGPAAAIDATLDLATLKVKQGDTVLVHAAAQDVYEIDGRGHEVQRSPPRRLRVISELDFATQLRRELSALRQQAIRIEAMQAELQEDIIDDGVQPGVARAQAQIAERVADQQKSVKAVTQRLRDNRLQDDALSTVLSQSEDLLNFAGQASAKAVTAIEARERGGTSQERGPPDASAPGSKRSPEGAKPSPAEAAKRGVEKARPPTAEPGAPKGGQAGAQQGQQPAGAESASRTGAQPGNQPQPEGAAPPPVAREAAPEDREIVENQQQVRDELSDLIELLDRDEDTWVVTRQLENLNDAQAKLEAETAALNQQTLGRSRAELTPQELSELDRIALRQQELADQGRKLIDEMRDRAKGLENVDPQSSKGLRLAANTGEQQELGRNMDSASQQAQDNQLRSAQAAQQAARRTMQQMRQDIDSTKRAKAEELQRRMASLVESIQRLVTVQEGELTALAAAQLAADYSGRDRAMIRLNQNTQAVAGEARAAGQEARRVARGLDRAADAQGAAVSALRAQPVNAPDAQAAEERSLELLKEAKALAEKLQEESASEARQQRLDELMEAYRQLAEKQVALRGQTLELAKSPELDRRQLVEARLLAGTQEQIRVGLSDLRVANNELTQAIVFSHVHEMMDGWSKAASSAMEDGRVGAEVTDRQQLVADSIGRLIAALDESRQKPREFAEPQDGQGGSNGGGQGGQQPLIPPIAELKLLRGIQEQVYDQTRQLDSRTDLQPGDQRERVRELGREQRELHELGKKMLEALKPPKPPESPDQPPAPKPPPSPPAPQSEQE